ncbi:c-type cytochrome [Azospirillum sp. sgz302134]
MKAGPFGAAMLLALLPLATSALATAALTTAAQAADPVAGRRIADRWCTSCHVVESGSGQTSAGQTGTRGTDAVPTLASIARDPRRGPDWLRQWLTSPHPPMPDLNLSRAEIDDVIAYLQSLPH